MFFVESFMNCFFEFVQFRFVIVPNKEQTNDLIIISAHDTYEAISIFKLRGSFYFIGISLTVVFIGYFAHRPEPIFK